MSINIIPETELRKNIAKTLDKVEKDDETLFVTKNGHAVATLISVDKYNRILSELEDRLDEQDELIVKQVHEARKSYKSRKVNNIEDIIKSKK